MVQSHCTIHHRHVYVTDKDYLSDTLGIYTGASVMPLTLGMSQHTNHQVYCDLVTTCHTNAILIDLVLVSNDLEIGTNHQCDLGTWVVKLIQKGQQ